MRETNPPFTLVLPNASALAATESVTDLLTATGYPAKTDVRAGGCPSTTKNPRGNTRICVPSNPCS